MLFVALGKAKSGTVQERATRKMKWQPLEGAAELVGEYWLQTMDPAVVVVCKADHIAQIWARLAGWDDVLDFKVFPAVGVEEGLELLKQFFPQ
jgi:hypothetical protein